MRRLIVVLTGPVAAGKSSLATKLAERFDFRLVKTWELIRARFPDVELSREALQARGEELDAATGGAWLSQDLDKLARESGWRGDVRIVIDAARISGQIAPL